MRRLVPAVSNSTSSSASPPIGWIFETTPEPNARCVTRSPTAKAGAAAYAFFVNNPVTRKCFVGIVFSLFNCAEAACRIAVPAVKAGHTVDYCDSAEQKSLFGRKNLCFGSREKCSVVNFSAHMFPPFVQLSFRLRNLFSETFFLFVSPVFFKNGFIDTL